MVLSKRKTHYWEFTYKLLNKYVFVCLMTFFIHFLVQAQSEEKIINQQIWLDFYSHYTISDKVEYYGDAGYRSIITERSWNRIYIRPSFKSTINDIVELHTGVGLFYVFDKFEYNTLEISPWQGIQLAWPKRNRISFKHLIKIEERLDYVTEDWSSSFEIRFRYKLSTKIKLKNKWYIPGYLEYFLPMSLDKSQELYRNKSRAGVGLGYNFSPELKVAVLFNWQTSRSGIDEDLEVSDYAYQLKIIKVWTGKYLFSKEIIEDDYY